MKSALPVLVLSAGLALLGVSFLWTTVFSAKGEWTPEKAVKLSELSGEEHGLLFKLDPSKKTTSMHSGENLAVVQQRYDKVHAELETLRQEFEGKRDGPTTTAKLLRWSGVGLAALGFVAMMATRNA